MKLAFKEPERRDAALILGLLRTLSWMYQTSHWQARGKFFYQDHLLFQRLYEAADAQIDGLAERIVGLFGWQTVDGPDSAKRMTDYLKIFWDIPDPVERALKAELVFVDMVKGRIVDEMPTGWKVFLEDLVSQHDESLYLLQQRAHKDVAWERAWHSAGSPQRWANFEEPLLKTGAILFKRESQVWEKAVIQWLKDNPKWDSTVKRLDALTYSPPTKENLEKFMKTVPKVNAPWAKRLKVFLRNMLFGSYTREFKFVEGPNSMISAFFTSFRDALHHFQGGRTADADLESLWFSLGEWQK